MTGAIDHVAFVVIGRNEGDRLEECLRSVFATSNRVVYADSASTDGSVERARRLGAFVVELDHSAPLNAARGRNAGLSEARAKFPGIRFVQFLDGDCVLDPHWTETALHFLEGHPEVAVACGRRFEAHPEASFYNRLADEEWDTPIGRADACGGDAMMRISALEAVGGFNSLLMASEEPELTARLRQVGWQVWRLDARMTEHDAKILNFSQWWRRTTRSGYGYAQAWHSTGQLSQRVNGKLLGSAGLWVLVVPSTVLLAAVLTNRAAVLLLIPLAYSLQTARIAVRRRDASLHSLGASAMMMLAKIPELIGAARYLLNRRRPAMIEYKVSIPQAPQRAK